MNIWNEIDRRGVAFDNAGLSLRQPSRLNRVQVIEKGFDDSYIVILSEAREVCDTNEHVFSALKQIKESVEVLKDHILKGAGE